jgi:hypothetical protein
MWVAGMALAVTSVAAEAGRSDSELEVVTVTAQKRAQSKFPDTQTRFSWVTQSGHRELPRKLPRFFSAGSEHWRSLANVISDQFESDTPAFPVF